MNSALTAQRNRQHPYSKPWYINTRAHNVYGNPLKHAVMIINHVLLTEKRRNTLGVSNACEFIRHALEVIYGIPVLSILCYNGAHCTHGAVHSQTYRVPDREPFSNRRRPYGFDKQHDMAH